MTATERKKQVMESRSVRHLTKEILEIAWDKDPIDALQDVELAHAILKMRAEEALSQ